MIGQIKFVLLIHLPEEWYIAGPKQKKYYVLNFTELQKMKIKWILMLQKRYYRLVLSQLKDQILNILCPFGIKSRKMTWSKKFLMTTISSYATKQFLRNGWQLKWEWINLMNKMVHHNILTLLKTREIGITCKTPLKKV